MSPSQAILRTWISRLFWMIMAALIILLIAHVPRGFEVPPEHRGKLREPAIQIPRTDPTEPYRIIPMEKAFPPPPVVWSTPGFRFSIGHTVRGLLRGDLQYTNGYFQDSAIEAINRSWRYSLLLFGVGLLGGGALGVLVGSLTAKSRFARFLTTTVSVGGLSIPDFYLVLMGQALTVWTFHNFGFRLWTVGVPGGERHWLLPVVAIAIAPMGYMARLTVTAMDEIMVQDYIRTARAKGLHEVWVVLRHALRNALPRVLNGLPTLVNVTLSSLVIVELMTSWPGLGLLLVPDPISGYDPRIVAATGMVFAVWYAISDALAHTVRILANPLLREVRS